MIDSLLVAWVGKGEAERNAGFIFESAFRMVLAILNEGS